MKKTARVIITSKCDRKCPGCCNSKLDYTSLAKVIGGITALKDYEEVVITGGEPMINPAQLYTVIKMLRKQNKRQKIYLYTACLTRIGVPVVIHAYYIESDAILMPEQIADKVPDAVSTGEMWVTAVPAAVRRIDYEIVDPYVPMRIDRNGTRERFLVWYGELKRVRYQDNWRNLSTRTARNQKAVEWFMENKPDISYRTFMSNMDDELLKSFHVELQEVWERTNRRN